MYPDVKEVGLAEREVKAKADGEMLHALIRSRGWFHRDNRQGNEHPREVMKPDNRRYNNHRDGQKTETSEVCHARLRSNSPRSKHRYEEEPRYHHLPSE